MDKVDELYKADADNAIQETYSTDEYAKLKLNSDLIKPKLGEMRDVLVTFLKENL